MHYMYSSANSKGRATLRMYHAQFPDRRMPDRRVFQWLHRELRETRSFPVTRHGAGQRRVVRSPSLEERILNVVADRPESSTRAVAHHRIQALNPADFLLRLSMGGTAMCTAAGLHSSCVEQLL
ncbi:uncharacterized protein TNCV_1815741 [Trichonephila clavipes]|nr:uncharacterized protein TNCV_1815741 [Trichonephila clavipes]